MIRVQISHGSYNWADYSDKSFNVSVTLDEHRISVLLNEEPEWQLPSDLIEVLEDKINRSYYTKKGQDLETLKYWKENVDKYDADYCRQKIESLHDDIKWWETQLENLTND